MRAVAKHKILTVVLSLAVSSILAAAAILLPIGLSGRPIVATEALAGTAPETFATLAGRGWVEVPRRAPEEGAIIREWQSMDGSLLLREAWRSSGPIAAYVQYLGEDPRGKYEDEFPGFVRVVQIPQGVHPDNAEMFCGNTSHSQSDNNLERCVIWGYWARYGQYLVYLETYDLQMSKAGFSDLVVVLDKHVRDVLH